MKEKIFLIIGIMLIIGILPCLIAENDTDSSSLSSNESINLISENTNSASETSDSSEIELNESAGAIKVGWKRIGLWFTFNQEKKAQKELELAKLMLIQAKLAAENNNTEAVQKAMEKHDELLNRVRERIENLQIEEGQGAKNSAEEIVGLGRAIEVHEARIAKLSDILANENLSSEQIAKIQEQITHAENVTAHLRTVQEAKKNETKTKLMGIANMTEEQANAEITKLENANNISEIKRMTTEVRIKQADKVLEQLKERIDKSEELGLNVTDLRAMLAAAESDVANAKTQYESGNYSEASKSLREEVRQERIEIREQIREERQENREERQEQREQRQEDREDNQQPVPPQGEQSQAENQQPVPQPGNQPMPN